MATKSTRKKVSAAASKSKQKAPNRLPMRPTGQSDNLLLGFLIAGAVLIALLSITFYVVYYSFGYYWY